MSSSLCVHKITQWFPSYCLHVERVKRLCYVHNIDTFDAMSKGSKDYVMLKQVTYIYICLLITFLIFNLFSIPKSFAKLRLRPFQPSNIMYVEACQRGQKKP